MWRKINRRNFLSVRQRNIGLSFLRLWRIVINLSLISNQIEVFMASATVGVKLAVLPNFSFLSRITQSPCKKFEALKFISENLGISAKAHHSSFITFSSHSQICTPILLLKCCQSHPVWCQGEMVGDRVQCDISWCKDTIVLLSARLRTHTPRNPPLAIFLSQNLSYVAWVGCVVSRFLCCLILAWNPSSPPWPNSPKWAPISPP